VDRGISIGQGAHWPDTDILRANGIKVITHTRFETLFTMLAGGRFDCFARGVSEVLYDLDSLHDHQLAIEPNLLLAYPMPSYFFVGPNDHDTAQRVQLGLERAIEDGSFARFLSDYYGRAVDSLNLDRRQILILNNPFLSSDSEPVGRDALESLHRRIRIGNSPG
jgi:ABC-type amino acid transport substrate-binding protein